MKKNKNSTKKKNNKNSFIHDKLELIKKHKLIIIVIVSVIIWLILLISFYINHRIISKQKEELETSLTKISKDYYEKFYYDEVKRLSMTTNEDDKSPEKTSTYLISQFKDVGVKISLTSLNVYENGKYKSEIAKFTKENCNKDKTVAIIYPQKPFGKKDYRVKIRLDCKI